MCVVRAAGHGSAGKPNNNSQLATAGRAAVLEIELDAVLEPSGPYITN